MKLVFAKRCSDYLNLEDISLEDAALLIEVFEYFTHRWNASSVVEKHSQVEALVGRLKAFTND